MTEEQATAVAKALRGDTWQSGGGIWLVVFRRRDGKTVVLNDEVIKVYDNDSALDEDRSSSETLLH
jgi:hypothetical protein